MGRKGLTKNEELAFIAGYQAAQADKLLWGSLSDYEQARIVHSVNTEAVEERRLESMGSGEVAELHDEENRSI